MRAKQSCSEHVVRRLWNSRHSQTGSLRHFRIIPICPIYHRLHSSLGRLVSTISLRSSLPFLYHLLLIISASCILWKPSFSERFLFYVNCFFPALLDASLTELYHKSNYKARINSNCGLRFWQVKWKSFISPLSTSPLPDKNTDRRIFLFLFDRPGTGISKVECLHTGAFERYL